jgi:uncharacterized membrane protein
MRKLSLLVLLFWLLAPLSVAAQEQEAPVVHAVLFYSPTCPHCHTVIENVLLPMVATYQEQLQILAVDASTQAGSELYHAAINHYRIPDNRLGVPTLIVANTVLVGSFEIPEQFPGIVETGLGAGGIDWPPIPALAAFHAAVTSGEGTQPDPGSTAGAEAAPEARTEPAPDTIEGASEVAASGSGGRQEPLPFGADAETQEEPLGFALGALVLASLVLALVYSAWRLGPVWHAAPARERPSLRRVNSLSIPILVLMGLVVAGYLAYVEFVHVDAVCGPVGKCNVVQSSPYAQILGVPVAALGMVAYVAVAVLWLVQRGRAGQTGQLAAVGLLALTVVSTLFSVYLTLLELLVIRAVCAWCLTSALITAGLMLVVVEGLAGPRRRQAALGPRELQRT